MAAIATGPALSDERVRQILATAIDCGDKEGARLAQEILDRRTADGINAEIAKRVEPLSNALDIANEVIASLGGARVTPDFTAIENEARDTKACGQRGSSAR